MSKAQLKGKLSLYTTAHVPSSSKDFSLINLSQGDPFKLTDLKGEELQHSNLKCMAV